jgi:endo-1,4-beta-D-glucanase Y
MEKADRAMAIDFLDYLGDHYRINSEGTSWEYFRQYKQLYVDVNGRHMDANDSREIKNVCQSFILSLYCCIRLIRDTVP